MPTHARSIRALSLALLLSGCDGGPSSPDGAAPMIDGAVADAGASPDAGSPVQPGEVDRAFGEGGFFHLDGSRADHLIPHGDGLAAVFTQSAYLMNVAGAEAGTLGPLTNSLALSGLVPLADGRYIALAQFTGGPALLRLDASFSIDRTFAAPAGALDDLDTAGALAVDDAGAIFVVGTDHDGTVPRIVVRKYDADGALDTTFGGGGTAVSTFDDVELRGPIRLAPDGSIAVLCTSGFTPCVVRFDASGSPDTSFGTGGGVIVDELGPRYPRALAVDADGRLLVLGMSNDAIQVARLTSDGALDATFGDAGVAELDVTRPSSSSYDEHVEARALALAPDGSILVTGSFELDEPQDGNPDDDDLLVARFTPDGVPDTTFAGRGYALLDFAPGAERTRTWTRSAVVLGDRLFVAGEHVRGTTLSGFVGAVGL